MPLSRDENAQWMRNLRKQVSTSTQVLERRAQDAKRKRDKRCTGIPDTGPDRSHSQVSSQSPILDQASIQPGSTASGSFAPRISFRVILLTQLNPWT